MRTPDFRPSHSPRRLKAVLALAAAVATISAGCRGDASSAAGPTTAAALVLPTKSVAEIAASARADLTYLADDAREGRGLGTRGLDDAGDYIAGRFERAGLVPVPSLGGYFQNFAHSSGYTLGPDTRLALGDAPLGEDDFTAFTNAKPGAAKGELAFVGYGIRSEEHGYDDFAGVDVTGKVVLAMRWEPADAEGKSKWVTGGGWSNESAIARKADRAAKAGAAALILVNAPAGHDDAERLMDPRGGLRRRAAIPVFHVTVEAANRMLAAGGAPDLATLQAQIDAEAKPASRALAGVTVDANVDVRPASATVRNVVAMLPGTGPRADEYVIVGAHYDHVGRGAVGGAPGTVGQIHNGADDNGSGTTAILQLADNFALAGRQSRSIVFVTFTLEELGLIGSADFVRNLPVPREKVVAMLNLDMVGRMRNEFLYVGGTGTADALAPLLAEADARSPIQTKSMGKGGLGPSDHANFSRAKIPVLFFFTGMHPDYHALGDDVEKINFDGVGQVTWLAFDVVRGLCAMPTQAYVAKYDGVEPDTDVLAGEEPSTRPVAVVTRSRVQLGVEPDYAAGESAKGVAVSGVTPGTAAEAAGMKPGDVITRVNDRAIDNLYDLSAFLGEARPGDQVKITVTRGGADVTLDVTLRGRGGAS